MIYGLTFKNWIYKSFLAGMGDEVRVVTAAAADGSFKTLALFGIREGLSSDQAMGFGGCGYTGFSWFITA